MTRRRRPREETSAGGIVFRRDGERTFFLLIRDSYRNWGFPKGHLEEGEAPEAAAMREVLEETGIGGLSIRSPIDTIDWNFRFRGRTIHKVCHFFLMETDQRRTAPQGEEGITACRWASYDQAIRMVAYDNARAILERAQRILTGAPEPLVNDGPIATPPTEGHQPSSQRAS